MIAWKTQRSPTLVSHRFVQNTSSERHPPYKGKAGTKEIGTKNKGDTNGIFQLQPKTQNQSRVRKVLDDNHITFRIRGVGRHHVPVFTDGHQHRIVF